MLSAGLALIGMAAPARAAQVAAAQPTQVSFWHFMSGGAGVNQTQIINAFNRTHPTIHVNALLLQWGVPFYTKLTTSVAGNAAPDVVTMHLSRLPYFAAKGVLSTVSPTELAAHGLTSSKFVAKAWAQTHYNGAQYAVPLDTHPQILYYNKTLAKQVGLLGANGLLSPITGAAQFLHTCQVFKQKTGKYCVALDDADSAGMWRTWYTLYIQQNGQVLAGNGAKVVIDPAKAQTALAFLSTLVAQGLAPKNADYNTMIALFGSGKALFEINGPWEIPTYAGKLSYDMALFPQLYANADTWTDAHSLAIPTHNHMDAKTRDAALTFITYYETHSLTWAQGGLIPAYLPVIDSTAFKTYLPMAHVTPEGAHVVFDPAASYTGAASPIETDATVPLLEGINGRLSVQAAVQKMIAKVQQMAGANGGF